MQTLSQQTKGEIMTIRATIANLQKLEAEKHVQLEKNLVKGDHISREFQKMVNELQSYHPLFHWDFQYLNF